jgi:hypothetical protein
MNYEKKKNLFTKTNKKIISVIPIILLYFLSFFLSLEKNVKIIFFLNSILNYLKK